MLLVELRRHRRLVVLAGTLVAAILVLAVWQRYRALERAVVERFSGRPWAVPARLYAATFPLYPGLDLAGTGFFDRLQRLGYREVTGPVRVRGDFRRDPRGSSVDLHLRAFHYPLHDEPGRAVRLELARGVITAVHALDGDEELFDLALEPEPLAGFYDRVWEERRVIALADVPSRLVRAVLAIEDSRFFDHGAMDWRGIVRALVRNLAAGRIVEGGSTLTQQLMKNFFLSEARTFRRKAQELVMAIIAERRYSKEQILELYLNEIYLGQRGAKGIFGVGEAAQFYFGKELADLTVGEAALLAGLIRAPNWYSPYRGSDRAQARRALVLAAMVEQGTVTPEEAEQARNEPIALRAYGGERNDAPYFVDFVRRELAESYPADALTGQGLRIFTTLDSEMQAAAETALREGLEDLERRHPRLARRPDGQVLQGALIALHPSTGEIKAMVGGRDYGASQFNRAADALRQPGSVFKPLVYFAALDPEGGPSHLLPTSPVTDAPFAWPYDGRQWTPANYEDRYLGPVTVRRALEMSLNAATARVAFQIGLPRVLAAAERLGMSGLPAFPAIVLGSLEATPLTVAQVYAVFASQGQRTSARAVKDVADEQNQLIEGRPLAIASVVSPRVAYLLTYLLEGVLDHGTGRAVRALGLTVPAAGKTGTTNDYGDAWFAGYTPELVAVVWVGFDRRESLGLSGSQAALPIWTAFMRRATAGHPARDFEAPAGVTMVTIDPESGLRATVRCPKTSVEAFLEEDAPLEMCPLHGGGRSLTVPPVERPRGERRREEKSWWRRWF